VTVEVKKSRTKYAFMGFGAGILNGLFGAGGGVVVVPMLESLGLESKKAHATSVALILPATLISTLLYYFNGTIDLLSSAVYLPTGLIGAAIGAYILKRIDVKWLKLLFAGLIIAGAVRILLQ
jgi:uncharacterized membrane protein YfcA